MRDFGPAEEASGLADAMRQRARYKVIRNYMNGRPRTLLRGLTLSEAQAWCQNPETSSRTCTGTKGRARTRRLGPWFDGYSEE